MIKSAALISLLLSGSALAQNSRPSHDGHVVMFGNLHAHSELSGDVRVNDGSMLPRVAFQHAMDNGLDFLVISDHHKATDSPGNPLRLDNVYKDDLFDVAMAFNSANAGRFVAIPGIEWGNTKTGNHINIIGSETLPPDTIKDADYDDLHMWARTNAEFIQFNHPHSWRGSSGRNKTVGNFGRALYPNDAAFVSVVDPAVKTFTIIATVRGGHLSGKYKHATNKTHRAVHRNHFKRYLEHLNLGLHISPSANQDTHTTNWGTVTAARTGVWSASASYDDLMAGFKANRVYATEDDEMAVVLQADVGGTQHWMGETVPIAADESDIELIVKAWQGSGSDSDPTNEGPYTVTIYYDADGTGGGQATPVLTQTDVPAGQEVTIPFTVNDGSYLFAEITEQNGKDNPVGDGEDSVNNQTGDAGSDNVRDDMNDSAWTTAIWFEVDAAGQSFVWSKNSNIYHDDFCWAVDRIGAANKRQGNTAPSGKSKHDCRRPHN